MNWGFTSTKPEEIVERQTEIVLLSFIYFKYLIISISVNNLRDVVWIYISGFQTVGSEMSVYSIR